MNTLTTESIINKNRELCSELYHFKNNHNPIVLNDYDLSVKDFINSLSEFTEENESLFLSFFQTEILYHLPLSTLAILNKFSSQIEEKKVYFFDYIHRKNTVDYFENEQLIHILQHYPQILKLEDFFNANYESDYFLILLKLKYQEIVNIDNIFLYHDTIASKMLAIIHQEKGKNIFEHLNQINPFLFNSKFYNGLILKNCYQNSEHNEKLEQTLQFLDHLIKQDDYIKDYVIDEILEKTWISYLSSQNVNNLINLNKSIVKSNFEKTILFLFNRVEKLDLSKKFKTINSNFIEQLLMNVQNSNSNEFKEEQISFFIKLTTAMNLYQRKSLFKSVELLEEKQKEIFDTHFFNLYIMFEKDYLNTIMEKENILGKKTKI